MNASQRERGASARHAAQGTIFALALLVGASVCADSVFLKGGERLIGQIVSEETAKIIFESQTVGRIEIPRDRIERIERQSATLPASAGPTKAPQAALLTTSGFAPWLTPQALAESNRFDWIELKSGEWLKGRIKSMQDEKLEFDSEEMDVHNFDWEDIRTVRSLRLHSVRFDTGEPIQGSLLITTNEVQVMSDTATNSFPRDELVAITPTGRREIDKWSAHVSAGMSFRSGNTKEVEYNTRATLQRRTPSTRLLLDYTGNFGEYTIGTNQTVTTEDNQRGYAQFDYFLSRRLFVRVPTVEYYKDPLQNLDHRLTLGGGVGYDLIHNRRAEWNVTLGAAWQRNWYSSVGTNQNPIADSAALTLDSRLDLDITDRVNFVLQYRGQFSGRETGNNTHHAVATLEFKIHKRLDLDVSFTWDRVANPETDASGHTPSKDDFRLNLGLGIDF